MGNFTKKRLFNDSKGDKGDPGDVTSVTGGAVDNTDPANPVVTAPYWVKITKSYTDFSIADLTKTITIYSLPAKAFIHEAYIYVENAFDGPDITLATASIGSDSFGNISKYMKEVSVILVNTTLEDSYNPFIGMESMSTAKDITATVTSDINLNTLTQGSISIYLLISKLP